MINKYFTTCKYKNLSEFVVKLNITNTSDFNKNDGGFTIDFIGGTQPISYTLEGLNYYQTNITLNIVNNLKAGKYVLTAIDASGYIVTKNVTIGTPTSLNCDYTISKQPLTIQSSDGSIIITQLDGGVIGTGYTLTLSNQTGVITTYNNATIQSVSPINNLKAGTYTLTLKDNSSIQQTCIKTITLQTPEVLKITNLEIKNGNCFCGGSVNFKVIGGTPPYKIKYETINTTAYNGSTAYINTLGVFTGLTIDNLTYLNRSVNNLCKAEYMVSVTDANNQKITNNFVIDSPTNSKFEAELKPSVNGTYYLSDGTPMTGTYREIKLNNNVGVVTYKASTQPIEIFLNYIFGVGSNKKTVYLTNNPLPTSILCIDENSCNFEILT